MRSLVCSKEDTESGSFPTDGPRDEESLPSFVNEEQAPIQRKATPKRKNRLLKSLRCIAPRCSSPQPDEEYLRAREEQLSSRQDEIDGTVDYFVSNLPAISGDSEQTETNNNASHNVNSREIVHSFPSNELSPKIQGAPWRVETSYEDSLASSYEEGASTGNSEHGIKNHEDIFDESLEPNYVHQEAHIDLVHSSVESHKEGEGISGDFFEESFEAAFGDTEDGRMFANFPNEIQEVPQTKNETISNEFDVTNEETPSNPEYTTSLEEDAHAQFEDFAQFGDFDASTDETPSNPEYTTSLEEGTNAELGNLEATKEETPSSPEYTTSLEKGADAELGDFDVAKEETPSSPECTTRLEKGEIAKLESSFEQSPFGDDSSDDGESVGSILDKAKDRESLFELEENSLPPPRGVVKDIVKCIEGGGMDQNVPKIKRTPAIFGVVEETTCEPPDDSSLSSIGFTSCSNMYPIQEQEVQTNEIQERQVQTSRTQRRQVQTKSAPPRPLFWRSHPGNETKSRRSSKSLRNLPVAPRPKRSYTQQPLGSLLSVDF